ncbi:site-specific integrase [Thioclava sp. F28-4]|uniref:site-specific integrase n=1 Tax=Thioclava sp. F28-4 TaxID=1915315 RepID=UPI0011BAD4D1|nr:site-specific integrase [Thioclava sp. F28-4]
MKTIERLGPFSIAQNRNTFHVRWTNRNNGKQESQSFGRDFERAREAAIRRLAAMASPNDVAERPSDPTFEELWFFYRREKKKTLSVGRARRLDELYKLYFKSSLARVPASKLSPAIRAMSERMLDGWIGDDRDTSRGGRHLPLSPNTIEDIVNIARATLNFLLDEQIVSGPSPIAPIRIPGRTAPIDRDPKGRHVSFEEIGALIDACEFPHHLHMLLFDLGCAARSGGLIDMTTEQILWDFDALDMLPIGMKQTMKYRPIVPVTGPMRWAVAEAASTAGRDRKLIHFRAQGLTGRNGTQIIHRIAKRALGSQADNVNWYSIRHTLIDFLEMRVPARSLSALAGHVAALDTRERRRLRQNDGSETTRIYLRAKLEHLDPIRRALENEWWREIQKHCKTDLRLEDLASDRAWADAKQLQAQCDMLKINCT